MMNTTQPLEIHEGDHRGYHWVKITQHDRSQNTTTVYTEHGPRVFRGRVSHTRAWSYIDHLADRTR